MNCQFDRIFPSLEQTPNEAVVRVSSISVGVTGMVVALAIAIFSSSPYLTPTILAGLSVILLLGGLTNNTSLMATPAIVAMAILVAFPMATVCV